MTKFDWSKDLEGFSANIFVSHNTSTRSPLTEVVCISQAVSLWLLTLRQNSFSYNSKMHSPFAFVIFLCDNNHPLPRGIPVIAVKCSVNEVDGIHQL